MLFSKKCVDGGLVFGMNGKRCDPSYYEGWFYEAGLSVGAASLGGDIGYDGLDLSGTVEVGGGIGKSLGIKWKSTWCYYKFLRYL